jgi:uncharacterized protein YndB with AHSA1/START domain
MSTTRFETEVLFRAPTEQVWWYLADPRNRPEWQPAIRRLEMLTPGEPALGTRWREHALGSGTATLEIVDFEPCLSWGETAVLGMGEVGIQLRFEAAGRGTRVRVSASLRTTGPRRLLAPGFRFVIPLLLRADLRRADRILARR